MIKTTRYSIDKIKGLFLGLLLGDAIGSSFNDTPCDEMPVLDTNFILLHLPTAYSSDTQMCISVFEEMMEMGGIDQQTLVKRFLKRYVSWRGYSGGMRDVIHKWRDGCDVLSAARSLYGGLGSFGDGAAVRASPISAFFTCSEIDSLVSQVTLSSALTHTHAYGINGAVLQAYAVLLALNDLPTEVWISRLYSFPLESAFKIKFEKIEKCLNHRASPSDSVREIGNGSDATEAVSAAIFSVLRNPGSFADALLYAVSLGGDSGTIGAMAGAIAGAKFGAGGIPEEWLRNMENGHEGLDFICQLVERASPQS